MVLFSYVIEQSRDEPTFYTPKSVFRDVSTAYKYLARRLEGHDIFLSILRNQTMSFQAYLDNIEEKTGKTPNEFISMAKEKGFDNPKTKGGDIVAWLKEEYGLGRGHAMAIVHIIKNGAVISDKHVGLEGVHRDESRVLRLDGKKKD
jgi:hypothetical protein